MFEDYTTSQIKKYLLDNKVLVLTNTNCQAGSLFLASMKSYINYVPVHNFKIVSGFKNGKPYYGYDVFSEMLYGCLDSKSIYSKYDYVIYIDEDCFITDFKNLLEDFALFIKNDAYCIAGPQDGGAFCHRNHYSRLINTFLSFWNLKLFKKYVATHKQFEDTLYQIVNNDNSKAYSTFKSLLQQKNKQTYDYLNKFADAYIALSEKYRKEFFPNGETDYAQVVKNDPNNPVEPHQIPYSYSDFTATGNFEPYYLIEEAMILLTEKPIYYLFGTDLYDTTKNNEETDNSGCTSAIYCMEKEGDSLKYKLTAVHTWFSRAYSKWPYNKISLYHTKRINKILLNYSNV